MSPASPSQRLPGKPVHLLALVLSVVTLVMIVSGSVAGSGGTHRILGMIVGALTLLTGIAILAADGRVWMKFIAILAVVAVLIQGGIGMLAAREARADISPGLGIALGTIGHSFFALTMLLARFTSARWYAPPEFVPDSGWPSMRSLAVITPLLVLVQVALGAGYRHEAFGIMPHVIGAMIVGLLILMVGFFALAQFPGHKLLRGSGIHVLGVASVQILLGIAAYSVRAVYESGPTPLWAAILPPLHVAAGAMTVAAIAVLSAQVLRDVRKPETVSGEALPVSR